MIPSYLLVFYCMKISCLLIFFSFEIEKKKKKSFCTNQSVEIDTTQYFFLFSYVCILLMDEIKCNI